MNLTRVYGTVWFKSWCSFEITVLRPLLLGTVVHYILKLIQTIYRNNREKEQIIENYRVIKKGTNYWELDDINCGLGDPKTFWQKVYDIRLMLANFFYGWVYFEFFSVELVINILFICKNLWSKIRVQTIGIICFSTFLETI